MQSTQHRALVLAAVGILLAGPTEASSFVGHLLGQWPGVQGIQAEAVQAAGQYAYVANGAKGLIVLEVADPTRPRRVADCPVGGSAHSLHVAGRYAYVAADEGGLQVVDLIEPTAPRVVGGCATSGLADALQFSDGYVYVVLGDQGVQVLDVREPAQPKALARYETRGRARAVQVAGTYAYVAQANAELHVLDITDRARPRRAGGTALSSWVYGLCVAGGYAYVAEGQAGLEIVDVRNPAQPTPVAVCQTGGFAEAVQVLDHYAWLAVGAQGLKVIDVSDPTRPQIAGQLGTRGPASSISLAGTLAYIAEGYAGLEIADLANPAQPAWLGSSAWAGSYGAMQVSENRAYLAQGDAGWRILDVGDPSQPRLISESAAAKDAWGLHVTGNSVYLAEGPSGLRVLAADDPAHPQQVGQTATSGQACDVAVDGNYAYLAAGNRGLEVIALTDPSQPLRLGRVSTDGYAAGIRAAGRLAGVADGAAGLTLIDVGNPAQPQKLGGCAVGGWANDVKLAGQHAFVAAGDAGLVVVDIADPTRPQILTTATTTGWAYEVSLSGTYAYVASGDAGLQVFDVSNPAQLTSSGSHSLGSGIVGVQVANGRAYLANADGGLAILSLLKPQSLEVPDLPDRFLTDPPLLLSATASSGLPVTFKVISGPGNVVGNALALTGLGSVVVQFEQVGDEVYMPVSATRSLQVRGQARYTGPWNPAELLQPPAATWGSESNGLREVYYDSVPFQGHSTRVFAYYAHPTNTAGPWPGILLVHGAGLHADAGWAKFWAARGYAALAMDLRGWSPQGYRPDSGPEQQTWAFVIDVLSRNEFQRTWYYHAASAILRGHGLLASLPEVDPKRIGVHGISWGAVLTCIVAGLDPELRMAVPVFGAGFLYQDNYREPEFNSLAPIIRQRWILNFDPAQYLPNVTCPMLFVNGATDFYFSLPSFQASCQAVPEGLAALSLRPQLPHTSIWLLPWADIEVRRFADEQLLKGPPLPRLGPLSVADGRVSASFLTTLPLMDATLWCTTNLGPWTNRIWTARQAAIGNGVISALLPAQRPLAYFLSVTDQGSAVMSTPCVAAGTDGAPADLRFTVIRSDSPSELALLGNKPWGHRVVLQAGSDFLRWPAIATNGAVGTSFNFALTNGLPDAPTFYRVHDLDW